MFSTTPSCTSCSVPSRVITRPSSTTDRYAGFSWTRRSRSGSSSSRAVARRIAPVAVHGARLVDVPARQLELELGAQPLSCAGGAAAGACGRPAAGAAGGRSAAGRLVRCAGLAADGASLDDQLFEHDRDGLGERGGLARLDRARPSTLLHQALRRWYRLTGLFW